MRSSEDDGTTGGHDPSGAAGDDDGDATGARSTDAAVPDALDEDAAPGDPAGPTLTVAAVAGRLGVAPATLRTWDRRYGLGPSEHTAGAHRRYSALDLARLVTMRSLTLDGVPPSDAARIAREGGAPAPAAPAPVRHLAAVPDARQDGLEARRPDAPATPTAVIDAALRADADAVARLLALAPGDDLARWWSDLVQPARAGIASRTVLARPGDEPDALVVAAALAVLRVRSGRVPSHPSRRRIVLLLAAPGEPRPLALHVLAGALADAGVDARVVAGPTGRHRLLEIAAMTAPSAVVLSSELPAPDLGMVAALAEQHPDLPVFAMVPDEAAGAVPLGRQVHRVRTVPGLVHEVLAVCG
ncbi:MerR family transcriptional regulator [Cellulomonas hominis]|uniref:MerR family transcriptional regulator n=1 Tax=Cellulomonas hominis TaxID=156981 RepID=UPI001C10626D|nr:MerR family transcriptional regulator [Cellulomonas hominis]MBU5421695.1 MerR family transcriptional regulator [Cellulomonas hominis]